MRELDLIVYGTDGTAVMAVEIKARKQLLESDAIKIRRNLLAHMNIQRFSYFMLVTPDSSYLWGPEEKGQNNISDLEAPPQFSFSLAPLFATYSNTDENLKDKPLRGANMELIVASWLGGITMSEGGEKDAYPWLLESGLYDRIAGGRVASQERSE